MPERSWDGLRQMEEFSIRPGQATVWDASKKTDGFSTTNERDIASDASNPMAGYLMLAGRGTV